ncbi:cyclin-like protein [Chytriomyces sp. MP71]|nr:cyclin-like protein [Chytriomyces sp. MP71]KAI8617282.1 cyclin-like protein [Chytriomyces sp. MP71]
MSTELPTDTPVQPPPGPAPPDLNIKIMCNFCKNPVPNIIENFRDGDLICGDCGLVLSGRVVDTRSEWRTFSDSDGDDPSRVGASQDMLLGDANTLESTTISRKDGGTNRAKDLSRIHNKLADQKKDNNLMTHARTISSMSERIGLSKQVVDSAIQLFRMSQSNKQIKAKPDEWVIAACICLACRQNSVSRTFKEICGLTNVPKKEIGKVFKLDNKDAGNETQRAQISPESLIGRFAGDLELEGPVKAACIQVGKRVFERDILAGRSTISLVASVIYLVACMSDTPKTAIEVAKISGCTESTLKTSYKILYGYRESLLEGIKTSKGMIALPAV